MDQRKGPALPAAVAALVLVCVLSMGRMALPGCGAVECPSPAPSPAELPPSAVMDVQKAELSRRGHLGALFDR